MTDLPDGFYLKNLQGNFFTRVSVACAPEDIEVPEAHELWERVNGEWSEWTRETSQDPDWAAIYREAKDLEAMVCGFCDRLEAKIYGEDYEG